MLAKERIVLAYSGGLDTSVAIPWLVENYDAEVIAVTADLGQGEELEPLEEKALTSGASKFYCLDLKQQLAEEFIAPVIKSSAVYEGTYLLGTSLARPLIAQALVDIANKEQATAIAHGATGKGNDQVRFEVSIKALNPALKVIAPWREWDIRSREQALAYAAERGIPVDASEEKIFSRDRNLWHLSHEGGQLEDPAQGPPADLLQMSVYPAQAEDQPAQLSLGFEAGLPVSIDGQRCDLLPLIEQLNDLAGQHGVGIVDLVENRLVGMKSRGIYETPGGTVIYAAHRALEELVLDRRTRHYKDRLAQEYAELVYDGLWFHPLREAMQAFIDQTQQVVAGEVQLELYKGNVIIKGRTSPYSLYDAELATFGEDDLYDQSDAAGFINLFGLPLATIARLRQRGEQLG